MRSRASARAQTMPDRPQGRRVDLTRPRAQLRNKNLIHDQCRPSRECSREGSGHQVMTATMQIVQRALPADSRRLGGGSDGRSQYRCRPVHPRSIADLQLW
jgi:hypothetical protein